MSEQRDSVIYFILDYTLHVKQARTITHICCHGFHCALYRPVIIYTSIQCPNYCRAVILFCSQYSRKQFSLWGWQCAAVDTRTPSHVVFSMVDVNLVWPILMTYPLLIGQWMVSGALEVSASHPARCPFSQFVAPLHPTSL